MKDTLFGANHSINIEGTLLNLSDPVVMGILNITPDSFYDGGKNENVSNAMIQAKKMIEEGASIIDIGGFSSSPGSEAISEDEELKRVLPVISEMKSNFPDTPISIDTYRAKVAEKCIERGAHIINDISAGRMDAQMHEFIIESKTPYIMMHMQNTPKDMQLNPEYNNVVLEVGKYFSETIEKLKIKGVYDLIIDVGFGFGKTIEHNFDLLKKLDVFQTFDLPILTGISRKSMLYKTFNTTPQEALNATTAAHMVALQKGSKILRVHDVKEAMEAIEIHRLTQL